MTTRDITTRNMTTSTKAASPIVTGIAHISARAG